MVDCKSATVSPELQHYLAYFKFPLELYLNFKNIYFLRHFT